MTEPSDDALVCAYFMGAEDYKDKIKELQNQNQQLVSALGRGEIMAVNIIHEPVVILATKTVMQPQSLGFASYTNDYPFVPGTDAIPELAGRICYQSFAKPRPGGNEAYIGHILEEGHGSVLEHAYVGFIIKGVSRALTHELIRHRAGTGVSQLSQRYCENLAFVMPPLALGHQDLYDIHRRSFETAAVQYTAAAAMAEALETSAFAARGLYAKDGADIARQIRKRSRESARAVLPNAAETHLLFTANLRAWRNILEQRGSIHADLEIRRLACVLAHSLMEIAPNCFQDFDVFTDTDGRASVRNTCRKV